MTAFTQFLQGSSSSFILALLIFNLINLAKDREQAFLQVIPVAKRGQDLVQFMYLWHVHVSSQDGE